ncbi:MAG: O-antigen ligase family protein [Minisyncoccia bacterium]
MEEKLKYYPFIFNLILILVYFSLITPLIVSSHYYFPFVGPKSLYFLFISQIIIFLYLLLVFFDKSYLPKKNIVLISFSLFLLSLVISTVLGVDFSRSFWSKYERMTGLFTWIVLYLLFISLNIFSERIFWKKIFFVSILISTFISFAAILEDRNVAIFKISDREGFTLGNTSFLGTYLLFNVFFALYLFFQKENIFNFLKNKKYLFFFRVFLLFSIFQAILAMYLQSARAAFISSIGGIILIFFSFFAFENKNKKVRILGKILLVLYIILTLTALVLIFVPGNPLHNEFKKIASGSRFLTAEISIKAFKEKPIFGWGPENFELAFNKYFDPRFYLPEYGGEVWFDRAHNIIFDTLVSGGIFGFISYLFLFISVILFLFKKYSQNKIDFWTFSIFTSLLLAYFVQNTTVFDMIGSLSMFIFSLAFISSLEQEERKNKFFILKLDGKNLILILLFAIFIFKTIIQGTISDHLIVFALSREDINLRTKLFQKALNTSPIGKYQNREFFASMALQFFNQDIKTFSKENIEQELNFLEEELKKTQKEAPLDLRSILSLITLYQAHSFLDKDKLNLAKEYALKCKEEFPKNQQTYWTLVQINLFQDNIDEALNLAKEAIKLEPKALKSWKIAFQIAEYKNNKEELENLYNMALKVNPEWEKELKEYLKENGS